MSEWEERINSVLNDPDQMARITQLAQSLMGTEAGAPEAPAQPEDPLPAGLLQLLRDGGEAPGREQALLEAMKPYLSEKRRGKLDRALRLARMAKLAGLALGEERHG